MQFGSNVYLDPKVKKPFGSNVYLDPEVKIQFGSIPIWITNSLVPRQDKAWSILLLACYSDEHLLIYFFQLMNLRLAYFLLWWNADLSTSFWWTSESEFSDLPIPGKMWKPNSLTHHLSAQFLYICKGTFWINQKESFNFNN